MELFCRNSTSWFFVISIHFDFWLFQGKVLNYFIFVNDFQPIGDGIE